MDAAASNLERCIRTHIRCRIGVPAHDEVAEVDNIAVSIRGENRTARNLHCALWEHLIARAPSDIAGTDAGGARPACRRDSSAGYDNVVRHEVRRVAAAYPRRIRAALGYDRAALYDDVAWGHKAATRANASPFLTA